MPQVIGIVGGGQLARMTQAAAIALDVRLRLLSETPDGSAAQVVPDTVVGDYEDFDTLRSFAAACDVLTFDHEHVPTRHLEALQERGMLVRPGPEALLHAQDKAVMRARLSAIGVSCPAHEVVATPERMVEFARAHGWPVVAKRIRGGYDGRGVSMVSGPTRCAAALADGPVLVEERIEFSRELSALVARSASGRVVCYPITQTLQRDGMCVETLAPAPMPDDRAAELAGVARRIAEELGVVGMLAVELMERPDGSAVVNELAMRPHNTGHWTIDAPGASQFENHIRAVLDWPLGRPEPLPEPVAMANVVAVEGTDLASGMARALAEDPGVRPHLYGKVVRPGRKVGHVSVIGPDAVVRARRAAALMRGGADG